MRTYFYLIILAIFFFGFACSKKDSGPKYPAYIIQGELEGLYAGSTLNKSIPFKRKDLDQFKGYRIIKNARFTNRIPFRHPNKNAETGNEPPLKVVQQDFVGGGYEFKYESNEDESWYMLQEIGDPDSGWSIPFNVDEFGQLEFYNSFFELIHFSMTPDKMYFNFLLRYTSRTDNHEYLTSLTFASPELDLLTRIQDSTAIEFNYLRGPGVKLKWEDTVPLHSCHIGLGQEVFTAHVKNAAEKWNEAVAPLKIVDPQSTKACPPFSDLNFQGAYYTPNFEEFSAGGMAVPTFQVDKPLFLDADIFIFDIKVKKKRVYLLPHQELENLDKDYPKYVERVYNHEVGHFLGLGHQFNYEKHTSVMGYKGEIHKVEDYDKRAIRALYLDE